MAVSEIYVFNLFVQGLGTWVFLYTPGFLCDIYVHMLTNLKVTEPRALIKTLFQGVFFFLKILLSRLRLYEKLFFPLLFATFLECVMFVYLLSNSE